MIRGTALTLNQRQTQSHSQHAFSNSIDRTQTQAVKRSSRKEVLTFPELMESLKAWQDPEDDARDDEAKNRIKICFKQGSGTLDLSCLFLSTLPDVIGRMQQIQYLSIADNQFSQIPHVLANLTSLKRLNISDNVLAEVPDYIKDFQNLELFHAACNRLDKVSAELARLPKIQTVILSHNRILQFPDNIHSIKDLTLDDQVPPASFTDFSFEFAARWNDTFQYEHGSGYLEMWLARYEEILGLSEMTTYRQAFMDRIGTLLDEMVKNSSLRNRCYEKAQDVVATCHDGILFSLFEMEIKQVEERIIALKLSDDEVRREMERTFNFYRLQELAVLHSEQQSYEQATTTENIQTEALETALFFYVSPANTLEMPLGGERLHFMRYPEMSRATDDDVRRVVERIECEKSELGQDFLVNYISDKEFWVNYLESRYTDIIAEHTNIFMEHMDELEARKDKISEYDYLIQANTIAEEKKDSEQRLYRQLTKNIVVVD